MPTESRAGTEIFWQEMGEGPDRALVLHCGLGRGSMWRGVAKVLGERLTMTVPDLPGHGRSGPFTPGRDVHDQTTEMARSFFDRPMHLIGHSFGGTVAMRLAVETPEKVLSLSLVEPVLFAAGRLDPGFAAAREEEDVFAAVYETGDHEAAARVFNRRWGDGTRWDDFPEQAREAMAANMPFIIESRPALWQDSKNLLGPGAPEGVRAPVTLIRGAETVAIMASVHHGLARRFPGARDVVIDGARHMLVSTHAEAVGAAILDGLGPRQPA